MYKDSLFRVSFKCLIQDENGRVLAVKESGRSSWDLPGGGIDYGETIEEAIARELYEEVSFKGRFSYKIITVHDPVKLLTRDVWAIKIVVLLEIDNFDFSAGDEADEILFIDPEELLRSEHEPENRIPAYVDLMISMGYQG